MTSKKQTRVLLWAVPRSASTAFCCSMFAHKNIKVLFEPFVESYYFGKDRVSKRYESDPPKDGVSFKDIKDVYEKDYNEYDAVFSKDMSFYLSDKLQNLDYIPKGYIHAFLIRDPKKNIPSLYKISNDTAVSGWDHFDAREAGFRESWEMYQLFKDQLGQDCVIIDSDDLVQRPKAILKAFCERTGLEFTDAMLSWDHTPELEAVFVGWESWVMNVMTSKHFLESSAQNKSKDEMETLPKEVKNCIEESLSIYEKMYALRLTV